MSFSHIFFYRYDNGTEGFGYYSSYKEANERMIQFEKDSKTYGSNVEFGIAEIDDVGRVDSLPKSYDPTAPPSA